MLDLAEGIFSDPDGNAIPVEYGDSYVFGNLPDAPNTPTFCLSVELVESVNVQLAWDEAEELITIQHIEWFE